VVVYPQQPERNHAVFVVFKYSVEDPSRSHVIKRSWVVFEQERVSSGQNYSQICSWDPAASIEANEVSLDDLPWPPDIDIGEHDLGGLRGCQYHGSNAGAGSISCKDVAAGLCEVDQNILNSDRMPDVHKEIHCQEAGYVGYTLFPKVRCYI